MAITSNASYLPTIHEFIGHWSDVNAERAAMTTPKPALVLEGGRDVAALAAIRTAIEGVEGELQSRLNDAQFARGTINRLKQELLGWFGQFTAVFDAYFSSSDWKDARPVAVQASARTEDFLRPMWDLTDLWARFNGLTPETGLPAGLAVPIELTGETEAQTLTQAQFGALLDELREAARDEVLALGRVRRSRSRRNGRQEAAYEVMKIYRMAMPAALPTGHELQGSLPRLTPADTGSTPDAVNASAVYVSGSTSRTTYEASTAGDLAAYQLRGVVGEDWDDDDAVTIATNQPGDIKEFTVDFGLTQPGTTIVLKVYVITDTGRERGSAPMVVARPAA